MNRSLTALFAAFEALLVVAIGIALPLAPLTVLWGSQYGFAMDWLVFWRASVDIWLLGHGADLTVLLDPDTAASLGLPGAGAPFTITIAALGFAMLTLMLGVRAGRRVAETRFRLLGEFVSIATFGLLSFGVTFSALYPLARPSLVQGTLLPTLVFAAGVAIGSLRARKIAGDVAGNGAGSSLRDWVNDWRPEFQAVVSCSLRGGTAAAAAVITVASVLAAGLILFSYARIITLYEALHTEVLGGIALTLGQLAFLPNIVIWTASWLIGPGFAIGTGSTVGPLATQLGPIPAIPMLGALPGGEHAFGFVGVLAPVLAGFFVAVVVRGAIIRAIGSANRAQFLIATGLGIGLVGGAVLGLLAWFSAGSAGPGRLLDVGPNPWLVAIWAAVEIGAAAILGLCASVRNPLARRSNTPR